MATSLKRHADISWYSQESYRTKLAREDVFAELKRPGITGDWLGDVQSPKTIPSTVEKVKSNVRVVGTRVVYNEHVPGVDKEVGDLVWIAGPSGRKARTMVDPEANWAGVNRTVKLAGLEEVNRGLQVNDQVSVRRWRLDGIIVSADEVDERLTEGVEHTTAALLVAFQGPTRIKNIFAYRPVVLDTFYIALVYQEKGKNYVWKPCSSQLFTDTLDVANMPLMHRSSNSAIPPPLVDKTPLNTLTVEEIPYVVGAYRVGNVLDSAAGSCTVNVDIAWVSAMMMRKLHGPSKAREKQTNRKIDVPLDEWKKDPLKLPKEISIADTLAANNAYFLGRSAHANRHANRLFVGPGYVRKRRGLGGRRHPRCGAGLPHGRGKWKGGVPENCGDGPVQASVATDPEFDINEFTKVENEKSLPFLMKIYDEYDTDKSLTQPDRDNLANKESEFVLSTDELKLFYDEWESDSSVTVTEDEITRNPDLEKKLAMSAPFVNRTLQLVAKIINEEHDPTGEDLELMDNVADKIEAIQRQHWEMFAKLEEGVGWDDFSKVAGGEARGRRRMARLALLADIFLGELFYELQETALVSRL